MRRLAKALHSTSHRPPDDQNDHPKKDIGFTLIELVVVIITIAILCTIAVPVYMNLTRKADEQVAAFNLKVAEEIHNNIWFDVVSHNIFTPGSECYRDAYPPDGINTGLLGYALVDADYFSTLETRISWVDMEATGPFAKADSPLYASLDGAGDTPSLSYEISGIYENGQLVESGYQIQNDLSVLHGKIAVFTEYYYFGGVFNMNIDNKYISMMVLEKNGDVHMITFYQGTIVLTEEVAWPEESLPIPPPVGPEVIDTLSAPGTINIASEGTFNTNFEIELDIYPGFDINCIDMDSVRCGEARAVDIKVNDAGKVIIKFDRQDLTGLTVGDNQILTVSGQYSDGNSFSGSTTVKVVDNT